MVCQCQVQWLCKAVACVCLHVCRCIHVRVYAYVCLQAVLFVRTSTDVCVPVLS